MIITIIGGIGQGKTVTAVKHLINRNCKCFVNFPVKHPKAVRLKTSHIIKEEITYSPKGNEIKKLIINWDFWNEEMKKEGFDIYIDEVHNVANSRRSLSKWNTLFTTFLTQIRKVLGDSELHNLYLITQRISGVDIVIRDLSAEIIFLEKYNTTGKIPTKVLKNNKTIIKNIPKTWIVETKFKGTYALDKLNAWLCGSGQYDSKSYYLANYYFRFYDSYTIVRFGESTYV